jgi:hypothetical protein
MKRHMKLTYSILGLTAGAVFLLASGCSKQDQPSGDTSKVTPPVASDMGKAAEVPMPAAEPAPPATPAAPAQAMTPAASPTDAAAAAPSAVSTEAQGLIDKAKGLVVDQKYQDALNLVQQLSNLKLTPEQQTLVDGLKTQIQTALAKTTATDAASSLGNALGGKK